MTQTLGKYEILSKLGEGATAEVYHARDQVLRREVALKILKPALVTDGSAFERFMQEARAAALLFHPNIATVLEVGQEEGRYYISMRYAPGRALQAELQERGALPWGKVLQLATDIGGALEHAHNEGFLHRDVKPNNIIHADKGHFILTDFGLTRAMMETGLTSHTGAVLGTPAYIPPEIWLSKAATQATDQYALACVIYEALTGDVLFSGDTPPAIMTSHVLNGATLPEQWPALVPPKMGEVLRLSLEKEPQGRFGSVGSFIQALTTLQTADQAAEREKVENARKETQEKAEQHAATQAQMAAERQAAEIKRIKREFQTAVGAELWNQAEKLMGEVLALGEEGQEQSVQMAVDLTQAQVLPKKASAKKKKLLPREYMH
jgi:eukaryotic-like serine/threonine-protein kinase